MAKRHCYFVINRTLVLRVCACQKSKLSTRVSLFATYAGTSFNICLYIHEYIVRWVQQACKCVAADFEKTAKNRFDAFLIRVHIQNHFCWRCVTEYACVILLCRFRFRSYKNLGKITDKLTIILVTRLLH